VKLKRLEIHNYKSLRNVVIEPGQLSVFVGPNAAGKSNFADALDFLSEVYRWDLETAVKKKGGYENICFRQVVRSSSPIRFRVVLKVDPGEWEGLWRMTSNGQQTPGLILDHAFELGVKSSGIRSPFYVKSEHVRVFYHAPDQVTLIAQVSRSESGIEAELPQRHAASPVPVENRAVLDTLSSLAGPSGLLISPAMSSLDRIFPWGGVLPRAMASLRVFQLIPSGCRQAGVSTPNSDLERFGGNLPAVIDYLKNNEPGAFDLLLNTARRVMPSLESIETDFTHTKRLALFLKEAGVKRPWAAEDISDGTIQVIALLATIFDPRIPILVIEEPENSVHPWAIRNFVQAFREVSETKQIFLTTHSPILIDQIRPEELWVVQRPERETKITPVLELDPSLKDAWGQGKFTLSEYLDSGAIPAAVPSAGA
jgi:predicted ATPase